MYTIEDLVKAAKQLFGYSGALVAAALKRTGKTTFTLKQAKKIIKKFARERVIK